MTQASKEAIVIILDVGRSMSRTSSSSSGNQSGWTYPLEGAVRAVGLLLQQKLLFSRQDEIGLVLFGTKETDNPLSEDGYQHITVKRDIAPPDLDLLKTIESIAPEGEEGDFIDALIVGMDLLIHNTAGRKFEKRIFLVTDAGCSVNNDDLEIVIDQFEKMQARLNVIGVNFAEDEDEEGETKKEKSNETSNPALAIKRANEALIKTFAERVHGVVVPVAQAIEMMSYFRSRSILQRSNFRGELEISPHLAIPVWTFTKTMERKFPTLHKVSVVAQLAKSEGEMEVKQERSYHSILDPDTEVSIHERVKGYKYGKTLVPFSQVDEAVLKYEADKCLKLIGFTSVTNIPRQHFMGNVECVVPPPGDAQAGTALSALVRALAETGSAAIARYVKRNRGLPYLVCLLPYIKPDLECLLLNYLPFAEDLRQYPFAPLAPTSNTRKAFVPSPQQLQAADALIQALDLTSVPDTQEEGEAMEMLKPKYTYNPALQRLYQCVQERALHPSNELPALDPLISAYLRPEETLHTQPQAAAAFQEFSTHFTFTSSESREKVQRKYWKDRFQDSEVQLDSYVPENKRAKKGEGSASLSMESILSGVCSDVGSINPVQDFKAMLARRDVDLVDKAIGQMKERINQLVEDSIRTQLYPKAIECLQALRQGCIQEDEPQKFNDYMEEMKQLYANKRKDDFWQAVRQSGISLITAQESAESTVSPAQSSQFLSGELIEQSPKISDEQKEEKQDHQEDTADNLFSMIE
jgi:ATP-dependent DNA helicase 2 subunit 2